MSTLPVHIEDRVRAVAHSLWLEEGMPEGRAETHWFKALDLVNAEAVELAAPVPAEAPAKPKRKAAAAPAAKKAAPKKTSKA